MKILLDSAFSRALEDYSRPGIDLHRWSGSDVSDLDLLGQADRDGYQAIVFLGQQVLARPAAREAASQLGVTLVVTTSTDPLSAQKHLESHLPALASSIGKGRVVRVTSHGVDVVPKSNPSMP